MKCKFCGEEMPDNGKFCPYCGLDNSDEAEIVTDETRPEVEAQPEQTAAPAKKKGRVALLCGCIGLMVVLALVLLIGIGSGDQDSGLYKVITNVKTAIVNVFDVSNWQSNRDNDIFKQDDYTVSDKKAQRKGDVVVATVGDATLTNSQLQVYYQLELIQFVNNYSLYLSSIGFDYTQPMDEQSCYFNREYTWQQYFLESALSTWYQYQLLALEAEANGYELEEELQEYLDGLEETMQETATEYGYDSLQAFFDEQLGCNVTLEEYKSYMETYYMGYMYFNQVYESIEELDDEALEEYFAANQEELEDEGISRYDVVDVRHILIAAIDLEGNSYGTNNGDGTFTYPDEELAAEAKAEAERILALWLENPTEEYFEELANEYSQDKDGEVTDGGIYEGVKAGQMVTTFNDWCFGESRESGDYAIVETEYGYHIMYFVQRYEDTSWMEDTQDYYLSQKATELLKEIISKYELDVDYSKIALAYVSLES